MYRRLSFVVLLAAALVPVSLAAESSAGDSPRISWPFVRPEAGAVRLGTLEQQVAQRERLGLQADLSFVAKIMADPNSHTDLGLSLNDAEYQHLTDGLAFQAQVLDDILPRLEAAKGFSGAYFDEMADGQFIVHVTRPMTSEISAIKMTLPSLARPIVFVEVDHTFAELHDGIDRLSRMWPTAVSPQVHFISIGSDKPSLSLVVSVDVNDIATVRESLSKLEEIAAPLPIQLVVGTQGVDAACTDREHCTSPMKAGNVIRQGSSNGGVRCTMGWHVQVGTDEQYVTSGHCGYTGSDNWYHQGYGFVGSETDTLYPVWGIDAMRVQISDTQDSSQVYGIAGNITSSGWPVVGVNVWSSQGVSNAVGSGTVVSEYLSWTSTTCGCTMWGAQASWSTFINGGDSGSPVLSVNGQAWGILAHSGGYFARLQAVLDAWGMSLRV